MIKHKHAKLLRLLANHGESVEFQLLDNDGRWVDVETMTFNIYTEYRVNPKCAHAIYKMEILGVLDLYSRWLYGGEVTAEHPACKSNLLKASDHEDPFHYFLDASECHKLSKKVVKVKQWLWIKVEDDKLVDNSYINEGLSLDAMRDIRSSGWIKTEHFVEVEK